MEIVALILFVVLLVLRSNSGAKKKTATRLARSKMEEARDKAVKAVEAFVGEETAPKAETAPAKRVHGPAHPNVSAVRADAVQGASLLDDEDCAGGSMAHDHREGSAALDDEDCAGGSMAHTHGEGVDRAEQARRLAALDKTREERRALRAAAEPRPAVSAAELRRAVVMAEILDRPKALRTRRV